VTYYVNYPNRSAAAVLLYWRSVFCSDLDCLNRDINYLLYFSYFIATHLAVLLLVEAIVRLKVTG